VLRGQPIGPSGYYGYYMTFPSGATTGQVGLVFGYKSIDDYWLFVNDISDQKDKLYHVVTGTNSLLTSLNHPITTGVDTPFALASMLRSIGSYDFPSNTFPSGQVGIYSNIANAKFRWYQHFIDGYPVDLAGRWMNNGSGSVSSGRLSIVANNLSGK